MIISHKHRYVCIDIPKSGSTSINHVLLPHTCVDDIYSVDPKWVKKYNIEVKAELNQDIYRHATIAEILSFEPKLKDYFVFGFVRNPFSRMVSYYKFKQQLAIKKISNKVNLNEWVKNNKIKSQYEYINTPHVINNIYIGRFENLQHDFNIICSKIGIPYQQLPRDMKTSHKHYTEYYDDETRQIVAERYAKDIEYFGYKFGE